jgi:predicted acyltransferase
MAIGWFSRFCRYWVSAPEELTFFENLWASVWTFDRMRILGVMQRLALCYGTASIIALTMKHKHIPYLIVSLLVGYFILLMCGNGFAYNETNILSVVDRAILTPTHMYKDNGIDPEGILSTIPSIAHVLLGFYVGKLMLDGNKSEDRTSFLNSQIITLFLVGTILTFAGFLLSYGCPINKKIWSPTFVLTTCGLASSFLALLIWIIDVKGKKKWSLFFEAFGVNPLFMYVQGGVLSILFGTIRFPWEDGMISIHTFLYKIVLMPIFGQTGGSLAFAILFVTINWCIGYQHYKRKIYIKI